MLPESLPVIKLSSWKEKFAKLVEETPYRPKVRPDKTIIAKPDQQPSSTSKSSDGISDQELQERWIEFLQSLEQNGQARLASHLRLCKLIDASAKTLKLTCTSHVTYETLLDELYILSEGARTFYQANVFFEINLDKTTSAAKEEHSLEVRFKALAEKSELVRYLIAEFGAELSY